MATDTRGGAHDPIVTSRRRTGGAPAGTGRSLNPAQTAAVVALIGVAISAAVAWTAWTLNQRNEHSLLRVQTRRAATVIESSIVTITAPLTSCLQIEEATAGDRSQFRRSMAAVTGPGRLFVSAELFTVDGTAVRLVASVGSAPELDPRSAAAAGFVHRALSSTTFVVTSPGSGRVDRIGYVVASPGPPGLAVYAERAIPADRLVPVESDSPFVDLDFATYLGTATTSAALATTDVPLSRLPLAGDTSRDTIPFGDTSVTLVASARGQLGGPLGRQLPWVFLIGGGLLAALTAAAAADLVRGRRRAERDAGTITDLYARLDGLYAEQRGIAVTLQQALLPRTHPSIPGLEIASRYVAGARGVEIGGDWYSLVSVDETHFGFVVGDVSGRGISAAAVMARLRYTMRAYLLEGHPPDVVLRMCAGQLDVLRDGHFATALVGVGDLVSREVVVANAGHLPPLVVCGERADYVAMTVEPPLGVEPGTYRTTTVAMAPGSTLVAFTDGLVERRDEDIDTGLHRLAKAVLATAATLDDFVTDLVSNMTDHRTQDDIAVLAFAWRPRVDPASEGPVP